jgi:ATF/CREB family transcription factor
MLAGPAGSADYFDSIGRGFPTPNESSMRTGLTPGGGGSMFPAPSPNSQAILSQLQSGGATPSTLEFHRTALNAAKRSGFNAPTSNPTTEPEQLTNMDPKISQSAVVDPFTHHDAADAANGLFMLAKGGQANANQFAVSAQSSLPPQNIQNKPSEPVQEVNNNNKRASRSNANHSVREMTGDGSDTQGEQAKPAAKGKGKKNTKSATPSTGRRKAEDTPAKGANKRAKANNGTAHEPSPEQGSSEDYDMNSPTGDTKDTKKMTDEEKRRNFLERNRYVWTSLSLPLVLRAGAD